jgi:hypothetical protein
MGGAESALLDPVPVGRAVRWGGFARTDVLVHDDLDGACAVFPGPRRLADYDVEGALPRSVWRSR